MASSGTARAADRRRRVDGPAPLAVTPGGKTTVGVPVPSAVVQIVRAPMALLGCAGAAGRGVSRIHGTSTCRYHGVRLARVRGPWVHLGLAGLAGGCLVPVAPGGINWCRHKNATSA